MRTKTILAILFCASSAVASTNITGTLYIWPNWTHTLTEGASTVSETFGKIIEASVTSGTNANQMTSLVRISGSLTNAEARTYSLRGGVSNSFGRAIVFARVNFLAIYAPTGNVDSIVIGAADANPFVGWIGGTDPTAAARPGGVVLAYAPDATGYAVETNSCDLKITNGGTNAATFDLYIGGIQ